MSPTTSLSERNRRVRGGSYDRSPSPAGGERHRRDDRYRHKSRSGEDERSGVKDNYKMDDRAHRARRDGRVDDSPPPAKRRRRSEEREESLPRREKRHDRS